MKFSVKNSWLTINNKFVINLKKVISINVEQSNSFDDNYIYIITFYTETNKIEYTVTFAECCNIFNIDINVALNIFLNTIKKEEKEWIEQLFKIFNSCDLIEN